MRFSGTPGQSSSRDVSTNDAVWSRTLSDRPRPFFLLLCLFSHDEHWQLRLSRLDLSLVESAIMSRHSRAFVVASSLINAGWGSPFGLKFGFDWQ